MTTLGVPPLHVSVSVGKVKYKIVRRGKTIYVYPIRVRIHRRGTTFTWKRIGWKGALGPVTEEICYPNAGLSYSGVFKGGSGQVLCVEIEAERKATGKYTRGELPKVLKKCIGPEAILNANFTVHMEGAPPVSFTVRNFKKICLTRAGWDLYVDGRKIYLVSPAPIPPIGPPTPPTAPWPRALTAKLTATAPGYNVTLSMDGQRVCSGIGGCSGTTKIKPGGHLIVLTLNGARYQGGIEIPGPGRYPVTLRRVR